MVPQEKKQRRLLCFLLLTVSIMLVELFYGLTVNSLGLVSDAFHMMLDAVSIVIGLYAAHAATWPPAPPSHPFGYGRYEALGGFVNGVLLVFIALYVLQESMQRLLHPPEIHGSFLLFVSVVGLVVNVIGVIFFHEAAHGHAHGGAHSDHSSNGCCCSHDKVDHNLRAVYLHIVADLLGSVNVIVSSALIHLFGLWIADPICSVVSAIFILLSALPLLQQTGMLLLVAAPVTEGMSLTRRLQHALEHLDTLAAVDPPIVWQHASSPHALLFCAVTGKLKSGADYYGAMRTIKRTARALLADSSAIDDVRVLVTLE